MTIKVSFLTGEYPPMQGGIADHTARLADHMLSLNVESSILINRRWQTANTPPGNAGSVRSASPAHPVYAVLPNWSWRCWPAAAKFLAKHQPDILHIQYQAAAFDLGGWVNWLPWHLKKRRVNIRLITTFHDLRLPYIFPKAGSLRWKSMLSLARYSDAVICTNREDLNVLEDHFPNANYQVQSQELFVSRPPSSAPLLTHIPLGSNVEPQPPANFDRAAWRKKYQADNDTLLLAYFGFLNESKGGEELIEALALLRQRGIEARLLFVGGEVGHADPTNVAYAKKIQSLIDHYGLTEFVYRTGYIDSPAVSANLLASDAVVMPYRDGVSFRRTTLMAALRHGCPVISTIPSDQALLPEIRPGENMLWAPPYNAPALADTMALLAGDAHLQEVLSQGARSLGNLFEWDRIASQTAELYRVVAQGREVQLTIDST